MRRIVAAILFAGAGACLAAPVNLALNKPYTLSPAPNYKLCTDPDDRVQLTDGKYVQGYFWTQKGTVGWNHAAPAIVTIDLGKVEPVCGVSWSCAAGMAGVSWPDCLHVLVSDDKKSWAYLGDLSAMGSEKAAPAEKGYATFRYATDRMKGRGRYVAVLAAAQPYLFVDEIEVWRGPEDGLGRECPGRRYSDLKRFYEEACVKSGVAARLRNDLASILKKGEECGDAQFASVLKSDAQALRERIALDTDNLPDTLQTVLPYEGLHRLILALHARVLRASGVMRPVIWQSNRWSPLTLLSEPPRGAAFAGIGIALDLMRGEVRGETLNLTNPHDREMSVTLVVSGLPDTLGLDVREVLVTDTQGRIPVASALRRMSREADGRLKICVPAGCTRQIWVSCARPQGEAKVYRGQLHMVADDPDFKADVPLIVRIRNADFPKRPSLHVGGWDYTQGRADYYRAPGNLETNQALMRDLYVDSPWATSSVFPQGAVFDLDGRLKNREAISYGAWDEWTTRWKNARNYCVFFSVSDTFNGEKMGTGRFNMMVGEWLGAWVEHLKSQALRPQQLVVLLVDEPHEKRQDEVIVAWAAAIKSAKLGVTLFEDPTYADPSKGDPAMFAASDILCPNTPMMLEQGSRFSDFYRRQKASGKTLWLYSCSGPAKLLDPVTYHRAQAWRAFQLGAEGTFFWAFGCGGGIGDSWRAYAQNQVEYSPYFVGPHEVMESKQSEAIREGVQDYEYLKLLQARIAARRASGGDAARLASTEQLLTEGVSDALRSVAASNLLWNVDKDRAAMDAVRVRVLDALDALAEE